MCKTTIDELNLLKLVNTFELNPRRVKLMRTDSYNFECWFSFPTLLLLGLVFSQFLQALPTEKISSVVNHLIADSMNSKGKLMRSIEPLKKYPESGVAEFWREIGLYQTYGKGDEKTYSLNKEYDFDKNKNACVKYFKKQLENDHYEGFSKELKIYNKDRFSKSYQLGSALFAWLYTSIRRDPETFKNKLVDYTIIFVNESEKNKFMNLLVLDETIDDDRINVWAEHGKISVSDDKASAGSGTSFFMGGLSDVDVNAKLGEIKNKIMDEEGLEALAKVDVADNCDLMMLNNFTGQSVPVENLIGIYCAKAGAIMASSLGDSESKLLGEIIKESGIRTDIKKYRSIVNDKQVLGVSLALRHLMVSNSETLGEFIKTHLVATEVQ